MKSVRIQRSRQCKQESPNGLQIKYVGRPTKWGNPFRITGQKGHWFVLNDNDEPLVPFDEKKDAIDFCVYNYKAYIQQEIKLGILNLNELKDKNLSCWCKIGEPCHADVLLELLNQKLSDEDLHILKQIRNYFGENDAAVFNHSAFSVIDRLIKSIDN